MGVSLVATDLDGTVWDQRVELRDDVRAAFTELARRGIPLLAATGRRPRSTRVAFDANGLDLPAVLLDGTLGERPLGGQRFHEALFDAEDADSMLAILLEHEIRPCVFVDHEHYDAILDPNPTTTKAHAGDLSPWSIVRELIGGVADHRVAALTLIGGVWEQLAPAAEAINATGRAEATVTADSLYGGASLSVIPTGVSKWTGVVAYCERNGIDPEGVVCIGDAGNDVAMLEAAPVSVAVRTGSPEAIAVADHLIDGPADGGWVAVLDLL